MKRKNYALSDLKRSHPNSLIRYRDYLLKRQQDYIDQLRFYAGNLASKHCGGKVSKDMCSNCHAIFYGFESRLKKEYERL